MSDQELSEVVIECKRSGASFAETLLDWGLADQETLHRCLLLHNARHFRGILDLGNNLSALFVPQALNYSSDFLYSLDELFAAYHDLSPQTISEARLSRVLSERLAIISAEIPSLVFVGLVRASDSSLLARWPTEAEPDVLRPGLQEIWDRLLNNVNIRGLNRAMQAGLDIDGAESRAVVLSEDSLFLSERVDVDHFAVIQCSQVSNLGLILARSRAALASLSALLADASEDQKGSLQS